MSEDQNKPKEKGWLGSIFAPFARWKENRGKPKLNRISTYVFCYTKEEVHDVATGLFSGKTEPKTFKWPSTIRLTAELISGTDLYALNIVESVRKGDNTYMYSERYDAVNKKAVSLEEAVTELKKWEEDAMVAERYDRISSHQPYAKLHYSRHMAADHKAKPPLIRLKPEDKKP